uniref:Iron hydrogenase large subunit C-terminal domain-containing protein n=1 Tax=Myotis lucifugus TaxID=59463 RepID=G1PYU1_MYOLU
KGEFPKLADTKIFLSDCLECDSCVTTEEGVQVSQQNTKDFFRVLNLNKHKVLAVSSLPYFAAKFSLSVTDASRGSAPFSKALGCTVFDMKIAADFSILGNQKEFVHWYWQHREEEPRLPMLTSACLGWDQYAEHVLGHPIPHLCTAKSPQQIMGSLVKDYFTRRQDLSPDKIFHIIVAPCYDKKLEALCSQSEIVQIMEQSDLASNDAAVDTLFGDKKEKDMRLHESASSDGYLAHILRHMAKDLFNEDVGVLTHGTLRNKDFQEVTLERDEEVLLRFEAAYGFETSRSGPEAVRGKFPYHFVEVLPLHGGPGLCQACLSSRDQAQVDNGFADRALLRQMEGIYATIPVWPLETNTHVQELYQEQL